MTDTPPPEVGTSPTSLNAAPNQTKQISDNILTSGTGYFRRRALHVGLWVFVAACILGHPIYKSMQHDFGETWAPIGIVLFFVVLYVVFLGGTLNMDLRYAVYEKILRNRED